MTRPRPFRRLEPDALPAPPADAWQRTFGSGELRAGRMAVAAQAEAAGVHAGRLGDVTLAVSELLSNTVRHAGGRGTVRAWAKDRRFSCEVCDRGRVADRRAGLRPPLPGAIGGRGLWIVGQVADAVEMASGTRGTCVRIHFDLRAAEI